MALRAATDVKNLFVLCDIEMTLKKRSTSSIACQSFMYHSITVCEWKLELSSANVKILSSNHWFPACVTLEFEWWPKKI